MSLICKKCGFKQCDLTTVREMKNRFPNVEEHDIPYFCGACMDDASEEEYTEMEQQVLNLKCPFGGDENDDCKDCAYAAEYHFEDGECVRRKYVYATHEEFLNIKKGDVVYYMSFSSSVEKTVALEPPFWNSDADEPGWEVETEDGYLCECDIMVKQF